MFYELETSHIANKDNNRSTKRKYGQLFGIKIELFYDYFCQYIYITSIDISK